MFSLSSCKKETTFTDFKFSDKPATLACENLNIKLYNEALYSFEDDILNFYQRNDKKSLLSSESFSPKKVEKNIDDLEKNDSRIRKITAKRAEERRLG